MKLYLVSVGFVLAGCVTGEERKTVLLTPAHYRLAEAQCAKEKGLLWIEYSKDEPSEFRVVCHSGSTRSLPVVF